MALPIELRERIIGAQVQQGMSVRELARVFQVGRTSVQRFLKKYRDGSSLKPGIPPGRRVKLGDEEINWLGERLRENPYVTSYELSNLFTRAHRNNRVHRSTILRAMHKLGFTYKKNRRCSAARPIRCG